MHTRTQTRPVFAGNVQIGGQDTVVIQSMCSIKTSHVDEVVQQILDLEKVGCQLIRVSVMDFDDAAAIEEIKKHIHIPLSADIHFDYKLAIAAANAGADKIRINPGNIGSRENVAKVVEVCKEKGLPIRIGINSGSIEKDILEKYGKPTAEGMIESAKKHIDILEDLDFHDIVLSFKSSDPILCQEVYRLAAETFEYPLHLGVTEAGPLLTSAVRSTLALGPLLQEGIGDTIRISVHGSPVQEIPIAKELLKSCGLKKDVPTLIACPTCGRTAWDMTPVVNEIADYLQGVHKDVTVAIMGCAVNGPGEAREADIAIAGGRGEGLLIKKGTIVEKLPQEEMVQRLKQEIDQF